MQATVFPTKDIPAIAFAARELKKQGVQIAEVLSPQVTHILLPVPTKELPEVPDGVTLIGGNLDAFPGSKIDLLREEQYLAENAHLTADCALRLLGDRLGVSFRNCPILIIGWGRIGKCLAVMLKNLDARVAVAARKTSDFGMLTALGYEAVASDAIRQEKYRAIINTAPAPVLAGDGDEACVKIDLASQLGISGENVLWARGLPGKMLPQSSGLLIAQSVLRHLEVKSK